MEYISTMLRLVSSNLRNRVCSTHKSSRNMITSAQKRALQKEQIEGKQPETAKQPSAGEVPPPSISGAEVSKSSSSGILPVMLVAATAGVGGAYYMGMIPDEYIPQVAKSVLPPKNKTLEEKQEDANMKLKSSETKTVVTKVEKQANHSNATPSSPASEISKTEKQKEKTDTKPKKKADNTSMETVSTPSSKGNKVVQIHAPPSNGRQSEIVPIPEHPTDGNRVSVSLKPTGDKQAEVKVSPVPKVVMTVSVPSDIKGTLADDELKVSPLGPSVIDTELAKAEAAMKSAMENSLKGLDDLSSSELRVKVVQLATEMGERAKWEAVRLREFLALKEKEVGEKYMEKMQKQRLEFEELLARRLREQEGAITRAANEALEAQEKSIESVVTAAANAQKAEFDAAIKEAAGRFDREYSAKYESEFGNKLAEEKAAYVSDLQQKLAMIEELSSRLQQAEQSLQISRNYESGSQRAHRVSAAAMALAEKMETSSGAAEEFVALKAASVENGVIASALEKIPTSIKSGIPTVSELQAKFEQVYTSARRAAHVPTGRSGIEGQIAGYLFSTLIVPPSFDAPSPEGGENADQSKVSDYILSRAKRHIQLGEIENAVHELDKLQGQAAFTVRDFKVAATDRITVNKALKVIKMECALMNSSLSGK